MELENKLLRREDNLNFRDEALNQKERQINEKMKSVADKLTSLDEKEKKLQEEIDKQVVVLESVAKMSSQAKQKMNYLRLWKRKWNMKQLRISKIKRMRQRLLPMKKAQNIIALAIERMSQSRKLKKRQSVLFLYLVKK